MIHTIEGKIAYKGERMERGDFRITHVRTDSRVATCFDRRNAELVVKALNAWDPKGEKYP